MLLMSDWGYRAAKTQIEQIEGAGIPVVVIDYNAQLLERHLASTRALGKITGREARAEELATLYKTRFEDILARVAKAKAAGARPRRSMSNSARPAPTRSANTYNNTMWGAVITQLGAENLATGKIPGLGARSMRRRSSLPIRTSSCSRRRPGSASRRRCAPATTSRRQRRAPA